MAGLPLTVLRAPGASEAEDALRPLANVSEGPAEAPAPNILHLKVGCYYTSGHIHGILFGLRQAIAAGGSNSYILSDIGEACFCRSQTRGVDSSPVFHLRSCCSQAHSVRPLGILKQRQQQVFVYGHLRSLSGDPCTLRHLWGALGSNSDIGLVGRFELP